MIRSIFFNTTIFSIMMFTFSHVSAWELPPDKGTVTKDIINEISSNDDYPETTTYTKETIFLDFNSYGKTFTQAVIRLTPKTPRLQNGKKLVVVAAAPGSEYGGDFLVTVEGKDGMGPWLAKRGFTFVALTRVGRWNFLADNKTGSWEDIPIGQRMPIFNKDQKENWAVSDYTSEKKGRFPVEGTELYNQMLAATPVTILKGFKLGLERVIASEERNQSTVLFWGMSTGGAFLWPLAKEYDPDGYLGYGTSSTGLSYLYRKGTQGKYSNPYSKVFLRVRERGLKDFDRYTKHIEDQAVKDAWWKNSLKNPRFKSIEDATMKFNIGSLSEMSMRLWQADFLSQKYKDQGFAKFTKDIIDVSFPGDELNGIPVLELNGTLDEAIPPKTVKAHREVMESYTGKYRVASVEGFHHYLFTQDMIKVAGSLWLKYIENGFFNR